MSYQQTSESPLFKRSVVANAILISLAGVTFASSAQATDNIDERAPYEDHTPFRPATLHPSQTDFGGIGLMQMPSGRMAAEGEFMLGGTFNDEYNHYNVYLQLMPWFSATVRYTLVQDMLFSGNYDYSGDTEYTDKGIDFKVRFLEENNWMPETSIGIRDIGGTGLFDGEFIAATKRFGNLDLTLGLGWGYIGQSGNITNPLCSKNEKYCIRDTGPIDNVGTVKPDRWFKGNSAIFGGIEYQTPYQPLRLKLEYDGNDYSSDFPVTRGATNMPQHTPWNVGVLYKMQKWADLRLSYERGDTFTFGLTINTNFNDITQVWRDEPEADFAPRANSANPDWNKLAIQLEHNAGYNQAEILTNDENITVKGEQVKYRDDDTAQKRAALLLSQHRPDSVKTYTFVETSHDMEITSASYDADKFDQFANNGYLGAKLDDAKLGDAQIDRTGEQRIAADQQALDYGIEPYLSQSFGGPESFYFYSVGFNTKASYRLASNLELAGSVTFNLADNYDKFNYVEDSPHISNFAVPRVRTLFRAYVHDNPVRMGRLQLTWMDQLSDDFYMQAYGGYLESMFAGVGGEVLYRPENSNWALGVDANLIAQRDPDSWFGVYTKEYNEFDGSCSGSYTVHCAARALDKGQTGFITAYYMPQWSLLRNTLFKVGVGQFLGQDRGVRADFSKQFNSGMIAGVYASKSDLSADEFGEGSFTKGFYISIPFDILTVKPSTSRAKFEWQPLTRDGGQLLNRQYELFGVTDGRSPWYTRKVQ
jgi:hypothetical protein